MERRRSGKSVPNKENATDKFLRKFEGKPDDFYAHLGAERHEEKLDNGLTVVLFKKPGPRVSIVAATLGGSRYDPIRQKGRTHFNEHMITSGTKEFPAPEALTRLLENEGGYFNAHTASEVMGIDIELSDSSDMPLAMKVISQCLTEPIYDPDVLETERKAIIQEINVYDERQDTKVFFGGTKFDESFALGTRKSIGRLTREQLIRHGKEMLVGEKMALIVTGNIPLAQLAEQASEALESLPKGSVIHETPPIGEARKNGGVSVRRGFETDNVDIYFGFRTGHRLHPDSGALDLLADIIGGGSASLLYQRLRYARGTGLVYSTGAEHQEYHDTGTFGVAASTTKENLQKVLNITTGLIKDVRDNGLSAEEVGMGKNRILKRLMGGLETGESWLTSHESTELSALHPYDGVSSQALKYPVYEYAQQIAKVTPSDLQRVAQESFQQDKWYLALSGDVRRRDFKVNF
jgi:predicted Zn-dependent peptidase